MFGSKKVECDALQNATPYDRHSKDRMSFHTTRDFSAFSSGDRNQKRQDTIAAAEKKAYEARIKKLAEAKERAEALDFTSEKSYPPLGSKPVEVPIKKSPLNFSKAAATIKEKEKVKEVVVAPAYYHQPVRVLPQYYEHQQMTYAGDEEEEDEEFNADLMSSRRRGDKGVW